MGYDEQIYAKINAEYEDMRAQAERERIRRVEYAYKLVPRLEEIRDEINAAGLANIGAILSKSGKKQGLESIGSIIKSKNGDKESFEQKIKRLEEEKKRLLIENRIPLDFDKPVYKCEMCSDTGYINGKRCRCMEQKLINEMYSVSNIENVLREQNFDTFSFRYFSDKVGTDGISELERMNLIHSKCLDYCKNFDSKTKSLLFFGNTGTGKTFLSSCIAKYLIDSGKTVVYMRAARLFSMYEDYRFGRSDEMRVMIDRIQNADFLIIDDLGAEVQNKNTIPFFLELLNERMQYGKKMLISTNFSVSELSEMYSKRFTSRLYEYFMMMHFVGGDIRVRKFSSE